MKVVSLNIGELRTVKWKGKQVETGIFKNPVTTPIFLGKEDVKGDAVVDRKYHGGVDKACYFYGANHYLFWKEKFPNSDLTYGAFGENVTLENLDESILKIGAIFQLGTARLQISQPRQPCFKLGIRFDDSLVVKEFVDADFSGFYVRVLEQGKVGYSDQMELLDNPCGSISLCDAHSLLRPSSKNKLLAKMAIGEVNLAESYKASIRTKFRI